MPSRNITKHNVIGAHFETPFESHFGCTPKVLLVYVYIYNIYIYTHCLHCLSIDILTFSCCFVQTSANSTVFVAAKSRRYALHPTFCWYTSWSFLALPFCYLKSSFSLLNAIPAGKRLHNYGKSPCSMGKSTINGNFQQLC